LDVDRVKKNLLQVLPQHAADLAHKGACAEAVRVAERMLEVDPTSDVALYNAACIYSLCLNQVGKDANTEAAVATDAYARRAMELLRQLKAGGFFEKSEYQEYLHQDSDLDALRARPEFQELLGTESEFKTLNLNSVIIQPSDVKVSGKALANGLTKQDRNQNTGG
jgi:hypothetical protein